MDYSIVVVTWECAAALRALVDSLERHLPRPPRLVVVDNASSDDPGAAARAWSGPLDFVALQENLGFGAAVNVGVGRAATEAVVLLNPDCELVDASLGDLAAEALRRGAIVGPRLLEPEGSRQPSAEGPPTGVWPWVGALVPGALAPAPLVARTEPWRLERPVRVSWLTGACLAVPRSVLLALPFDADVPLYGEDMDLGLRAARAGVASWFCPDVARVRHHGGVSTARRLDDEARVALKARRRREVVRQTYGARAEARARRALRLRFALRVAAQRLLGRDAARDRLELRALERT